jgi:hypothetical protein
MKSSRYSLAVAAFATMALVVAGTPATAANDDDVIVEGNCSKRADYKLKASPEDGRLEIEGEVDSNRVGQTWRWKLWHNGSLTGKGTRRTKGDSGSFEVDRVIVDMAGTDWSTFKARNIRSGEICRGVVGY